ncbi:MAG: GIY-YIG nuclease family protein [bacterium]|nr:GIY-YIG nuclease family protein [bacterium]
MSASNPYFVYVLCSTTTGETYVGQTSDVERRLAQHNDPDNKLTLHTKRRKGPWIVVHTEAYPTRSEAMKREKYFKTGRGREELKRILNDGC